jgi:hypothetical protein
MINLNNSMDMSKFCPHLQRQRYENEAYPLEIDPNFTLHQQDILMLVVRITLLSKSSLSPNTS